MVRVRTILFGGITLELNYFKDHLFDLVNDSELLCIRDIITKDKEDKFIVVLEDGSVFEVACSIHKQIADK